MGCETGPRWWESEKTLISMSLVVVNSFGEGTIMVRANFWALVRMMRMLVADGLSDEVEQDEYAYAIRAVNLLNPGYESSIEVT